MLKQILIGRCASLLINTSILGRNLKKNFFFLNYRFNAGNSNQNLNICTYIHIQILWQFLFYQLQILMRYRSRAMSDKQPVIYRQKLPSFNLQKKDKRPRNKMFIQIFQTQSASKHIKNRNNRVEEKSESTEVKKLQKLIENKEKQLQKCRSIFQQLMYISREIFLKSTTVAEIGNMEMANYYLELARQIDEKLSLSVERQKILVSQLNKLKLELKEFFSEKICQL